MRGQEKDKLMTVRSTVRGWTCAAVLAMATATGSPALAAGACPPLAGTGTALLSSLVQTQQGRNVLVSPYGVAMALSMAWHGADQAGRTSIEKALNLKAGALADLDACLPKQAPSKGVTLSVANAAWVAPKPVTKAPWRESLRAELGAEVQQLKGDQGDTKRINAWIAKATADRIKSVVTRLSASTSLALVNAVYFNGAWATQFPVAATKPGTFHTAAGGNVTLPMMALAGASLPYREDGSAEAVLLPYTADGWRLAVIVPKPVDGKPVAAAQWLARADAGWLTGAGYEIRTGAVTLPRFQISSNGELLAPLRGRGMALDGRLTGIAAPSPRLTEIMHSTVLRVDEKGAEAAAATVVLGERSMVIPFDLVADRPFVVALGRPDTGLLLFLGVVEQPGAKE